MGVLFGMEKRLELRDTVLLGVALAYKRSNFSVSQK